MAAPELRVEVAAYLAERYWPGLDRSTARDAMRRLAAQAGAGANHAPMVLACAFVPDEQALLLLVSANSADDVAAIGRRAGVSFDRVVEAVVLRSDEPRGPAEP